MQRYTKLVRFAPFVLWAVNLTEKPAVPAGQVSERSTSFLRAVATACGLLLIFAWISNSVPQLENHPPKKVVFDPSQISTTKDLVREGKNLYFSKGQCALCHSIEDSASARCPKIGGIGGRLTKEFLIESLVNPSKYIYLDYRGDFPRNFPADMPVIDKPPINLTMQETLLVVAFLQSLGGEVTVTPEEVKALTPATAETVEEVTMLTPTTVETVVETEEVKAIVPITADTVEEDDSHAN